MKFHRKIALLLMFVCALWASILALPSRAKAITFNDCDTECLTPEFIKYHIWMVGEFWRNNLLRALMMMTEQMNAVAMHQMMIIGTFLDAKHQLETQRLFQTLQLQAHKDYQPSEEFCWFGTNTRSLAASEQVSRYNKLVLSTRQLGRQLGNANKTGAGPGENQDSDKEMRWKLFAARYCDPQDNTWRTDVPNSGLTAACQPGAGKNGLANLDIDYTRLIEEPRSLNVLFHKEKLSKPTDPKNPGPNEQDIIAMGNNLYGHNIVPKIKGPLLADSKDQDDYITLRSVAAKRSVAENSYNSIVALKVYGSTDDPDKDYNSFRPYTNAPPQTREYLARIMVDLGISKEEVYDLIGMQPSYYAQLEILAKKIYQNPTFYASLYDTPVNVARKGAALKAIDLMLGREMYESQLRREMNISVLLSARLHKHFRRANDQLRSMGVN